MHRTADCRIRSQAQRLRTEKQTFLEETMSLKISMTVNGKPVSGDIEPRTLLVDFIRDICA